MEKAAARLEKFFFLFLFINPFLDIIGGAYLNLAESFGLPTITPSLIVRMLVLLLFAAYVLIKRNWRAVVIMVPLVVAWALSLAGELMYYYSIDLSADVQYIVRFAFNIAVILVYATVFKNSALNRKSLLAYINRAFVFSAALLSATIVLPYLLGLGFSTYGDRFGYRGSRGFFFSGNDITAVLLLLLPIAFYVFFTLGRGKLKLGTVLWHAASPALTITALAIIGTKTAFFAIAGSCAVMLGYGIYTHVKKKDRTYLTRFGIVILAFAMIFGLLMLVTQAKLASDIRASLLQPGVIAEESGLSGAILSGRGEKLNRALGSLRRTTPYSVLFGTGRGTQVNVIEMDIFEVVIYYGVFGAIVMLWLYLKLGVGFLKKAFKKFDLMGLALLASLGMCVGYLVMAGHILFSVTSGFYFSLLLVYAHLYYAPTPKKLKI